ncbi:MAG: hypothetical protein QXO76_05280 [Thermoproteota archaeon]
MVLKFIEMSSNEYNRETEAISETPGHFTMKAIKIVIEEAKKVIRRVSIRMIRRPESTEMGFKNWNTLKQLIITEKKTEDTMTINKVKC